MPLETAPLSEKRSYFRAAFACTLMDARNAAIALRDFLNAEGFSPTELDEWELAVVEAANNAVNYAPDSRKESPVVIEASVSQSITDIRIIDNTEGFDLPETVELPDFEMEGGRGIYLIRTLTDSANYFRGKSRNVFELSKKRKSPGAKPRTATVEQLEGELTLMTEELAASYESLSAIFSFTSTLANASDPMDLVEPWIRELARVTGAAWHAFFVVSPDGRSIQCATASSEAVPSSISILPEAERRSGSSAAARTVQSRQDFWFEIASPLPPDDPLATISNGTSGLLHGVFLGSVLVGLVALGRSVPNHPFTAGQVNVIHTFSDFLGAQLHHAQVRNDSTRHQIMRRDLEIAASIQQSLLPDELPSSPGLEIFGSATSAREIGGDFYDVIGLPDGSVLVVIADVMGKGVPAALFAAILRTLVRSRCDLAEHPGELLEWVAGTLFEDFERVEMFATMQLAYFDIRHQTVHVAGAGHCPLLIAPPSGPVIEIASEGVPVGILQAARYPEAVHPVAPGSRLLLFTDGVTESRDVDGDQWGMRRLLSWLSTTPPAHPEALGADLLARLAAHRGAASVPDDITFVLFTTHP